MKTKKSLTFYVLHLPVLLLILGVFALTTFVSNRTFSNRFSNPDVLSSGSGEDGDDDDDEDETDVDEDEDEGDDDDGDDEDNSGSDSNDDDEDEDELEVEDDLDENDEDETEIKTEQKITNSDGSYSIVKKETEGDKTKIEVKTFSVFGKLLSEEKYEGSDEGIESETEDSTGNKLKIRLENNKVLIKSEGVTGLNNFPLIKDAADGSIYVRTPNGDIKLGVMPQAIIEKAQNSDGIDVIEEVEIEDAEDSEEDDDLEFRLETKKSQKLFGVFKLEIPSTFFYDAQSGEYLRSYQPIISQILDFLSF